MNAFATLRTAGLTTRAAAALTGISRATMDRAAQAASTPAHPLARAGSPAPKNKLTGVEEQQVLAVLHSPEFIDQAPAEVYATLLERGEYLCSIASMYRILRRHNEVRDRRRQARHPSRARPELTATEPGQVYTWDITKLPGPRRGVWFDAYVMIDIYSRMIVGCRVHAHESAPLAAEMMREVFGVHGIPHVVHADRGTSMTSKTVAHLLEDLGVDRSHSRPRVSNDNPFSEALFKTVKYAPTFPDRFATLAEARAWMEDFSTGTTTSTTTLASGCTPLPTFITTAPSRFSGLDAGRWIGLVRPTLNASRPGRGCRRSLTCRPAPGSTDPTRIRPSRTQLPNTRWPQPP